MIDRDERIIDHFIAIEGIDGSGSSTQVKLVTDKMSALSIPCIRTEEPSRSSMLGHFVKAILRDGKDISGDAMSLLFAADRAEKAKNIEDHCRNKIVVSDRCIASSFAYQGITTDEGFINAVNVKSKIPSFIIYLDVHPRICQERRRIRGTSDEMFDDLDVQHAVMSHYEHAIEAMQLLGVNVVRVDGSGLTGEVFSEVWETLSENYLRTIFF